MQGSTLEGSPRFTQLPPARIILRVASQRPRGQVAVVRIRRRALRGGSTLAAKGLAAPPWGSVVTAVGVEARVSDWPRHGRSGDRPSRVGYSCPFVSFVHTFPAGRWPDAARSASGRAQREECRLTYGRVFAICCDRPGPRVMLKCLGFFRQFSLRCSWSCCLSRGPWLSYL
ncbi:MAG: hypothetical protein RL091_1949 [Verrucomicrobiota bacterium]|jgi:hypothetical protein